MEDQAAVGAPAAPRKKARARKPAAKKAVAKAPRKPRAQKPKDDPRFETLAACPLCEAPAQESKPFCAHTGDPYLHAFDNSLAPRRVQWWFCEACGFVYQSPRLTAAALDAFYAEGYRKDTPSPNVIQGKLQDAARVVDFIKDQWNPPGNSGKCLDIGSGEGCMVKAFGAVHKAGGPRWDAYGVEPNVMYAEFARHQMTVQVATEAFTDKSWRGIDFRLITAQHVLEHIHDFKGFLRTAKNRLRPEGRLYIGTPAVEMPWGENWARPTDTAFETYAATHLHLFSSRTLCRALNDCGFYVETIDHYLRGILCLARNAEEGERNELAGRDDPQILIGNVKRGHDMWQQYISDPKRRHPFVQEEQKLVDAGMVSASKVGKHPGDPKRIDGPVQQAAGGAPGGAPAGA